MFPIKNSLNKEEVLTPWVLCIVLDYAIRRVQVIQDGFKLICKHRLLFYAYVNILGIHTIKRKKKLYYLLIRRFDEMQMMVNLRKSSCLEIRVQDDVTI